MGYYHCSNAMSRASFAHCGDRRPSIVNSNHCVFGVLQYSLPGQEPRGDIFYFDYGVVAFWGLSKTQERDVLKNLVYPCEGELLFPSIELLLLIPVYLDFFSKQPNSCLTKWSWMPQDLF